MVAVEDGSLGGRNVDAPGGRLRWDVGVLDVFSGPVKTSRFQVS